MAELDLDVGIIDAGPVGAVLGRALRATGFVVAGISASDDDQRARAETLLDGVPLALPHEVAHAASLLVLAVPATALHTLVAELDGAGAFQPGQIVIHTVGRWGTDILEPVRAHGAVPLAIHPAIPFTGTSVDLARLVGSPFLVSADPATVPLAVALTEEIGGVPTVVATADRPLADAALTHATAHVTTVLTESSRALVEAGVDSPGPLLQSLAEAATGTRGGPVATGDADSVRAHVQALDEWQGAVGDSVAATYRHLARVTVARAAQAADQSPESLDAAARILDALA